MAAPVHSRTTRLQEYWISRRGGRVQERRRNGTGEHETMSLAIRIDAFGGPEVLQPADIAVPAPGPGELRVRNRAIGVKYGEVVCCECFVSVRDKRRALLEMGVGPPESVCRDRLQTAT